jgi:hypothetical protein
MAMSWEPRLLSLEESIALIVVSGFLCVIPAFFYGYGLRMHNWPQLLQTAIGIGMFAYGLGSAIVVSKRNSHR